jgi:hypothetical protein
LLRCLCSKALHLRLDLKKYLPIHSRVCSKAWSSHDGTKCGQYHATVVLALSCTVYALCGFPAVLCTVSRTETDDTPNVWQRVTDIVADVLKFLCCALQQAS